MKTFAQRQVVRKERATVALADFERENTIADAMPVRIRDQIKFVHLFGRGPVIAFEVDTLADALPILAELDPVKFYYLNGGTFAHINPREWIKPQDWDNAKQEMEFCAPYMEAASGARWQECKVHTFIELEGKRTGVRVLAKVSISIANPAADFVPRMVQEYHACNGRKKRGERRRVLNGLGECKCVTWSTGSADAARASYLFHDAIAWQQFIEREVDAAAA